MQPAFGTAPERISEIFVSDSVDERFSGVVRAFKSRGLPTLETCRLPSVLPEKTSSKSQASADENL
jgi:hypothetical protein